MAEMSPEEQREKFTGQMKELGNYAGKCKAGYGKLTNYLDSLYQELDGLIEILPPEAKDSGKIKDAHSSYKAGLEAAKGEISKYTELDKLVKKVLSGSIEQEEAKQVISDINTAYSSIVNASLGLYQLMDPEIDASKLINVYSQLAQQKNVDIQSKFKNGVIILKQYYVTQEMLEKFIGARQQQPQATA